jgi:Glycine rich protein
MLVRVAGAARMVQRRGSALLGLAVACAALAASAAPASAATTQAFAFTGTEQTFTVPTGVTSLHVVAVGAKGGNGSDESAKKLGGPGGLGASVEADLPVTPGQVLYVEVGGTGANGSAGGAGGFNGGGASNDGVFKLPGGGGGGATDIRSCSRVALTCAGVLDTLSSRLLIAAGGGGGGSLGRNEQPTGGDTCTLSTTRVATLGRKGHLGVNKVAFTGRIGGKPLAPARYLAVFTAKDSAGSSAPQRIAFTVVKR